MRVGHNVIIVNIKREFYLEGKEGWDTPSWLAGWPWQINPRIYDTFQILTITIAMISLSCKYTYMYSYNYYRTIPLVIILKLREE